MYCIKCGVRLSDTEDKCPLCNTVVYHPTLTRNEATELYPKGKMPKTGSGRAFLCGAVIILFMIPIIVTLFTDLRLNGRLDWFGFVAGGHVIAYFTFAFPMWFKNPSPVVLVPCDFAICALYLLYINLAMGGRWFLTLALPITLATALIVCTLVTLIKYLRKGKLYVIGGSVMALGALVLMIEFLTCVTFDLKFTGWSLYPLISLLMVGGLLIYLAISSVAREKIERKLFF